MSQTSAERIVKASKEYGDDLHFQLENIQSVPVHRKCIDRYCHKKTIKRARSLREKAGSPSAEDLVCKPKRARRSEQPNFSFLQNCLFCGELCVTMKDPKHPGRWRPAYVCREGERFGNKGLKEAILETCDKRKDIQSEQIKVRMAGFLTDTCSRCEVSCRLQGDFLVFEVNTGSNSHQSIKTELKDAAFDSLVKYLDENKANIHSSIDRYTKYMEEGGHVFSRRQLVQQIVEKFGGDCHHQELHQCFHSNQLLLKYST